MAYNKKNWQDNVSDITAAELNKIEQGIYDNSLVAEAVTNTLNPTDTETYKTAELTEGQITDVIGVSDIVIKGQTSQDGEPTPSSPVDVNVVSGSNVIRTNNKNLLPNNAQNVTMNGLTFTINKDKSIKINGTASAYTDIYLYGGTTDTGNYLHFPKGTYSLISTLDSNLYYIAREKTKGSLVGDSSILQALASDDCYFYGFFIRANQNHVFNNFVIKPQLEKGSTATTYETHQGKELPLDLPVENLCTTYNFANAHILNDGQIYEGTDRFATDYIKVKGNTQYILHFKDNSNINFYGVAYYDANKTFISRNTKNGGNNLTFTTDSNTVYIRVFGQPQIGTIFTEESFNTYKIQLEQGSKANAYTPYGTNPIELCKIGNYQDYFYKSGSKWYLHKEVEKYVVNGSSNEQWYRFDKYFRTIVESSYQEKWITNTLRYPNQIISNMKVVFYQILDNQEGFGVAGVNGQIRINLENIDASSGGTVEQLRAYLAENPVTVYVAIKAAETEITDTTLISQLEAIYNAPLYEQTNITQTNNDLPMVLDITACKDNINGIKAFIRK